MLKIPIESIIQRICAETGMTRANVENQIKAKIKALDGLVSEEGAAFIVASELGVQLLNEPATSQSWKIKDLVAGMPPVDVFGDVTRILGVKPYKHKGQAKEMGSFILKDDTGEIRVVLWDDRVQMLKEGKIRGRVRIKAAQVKQNKFGGKELHVGSKSSLIVTDSGVDWQKTESKEYKISELQVGETAKIMAEIVKLFPPKSYPVCKSCGKKVIPAPEGFFCSTHKIVVPENRLLLSFYLDDGTEAIRATAFGETAKKICSVVNTEITLSLEFLELLQNQLLGRTIIAEGRVKENKNFSRKELIIDNINLDVDPKQIITKMLEVH